MMKRLFVCAAALWLWGTDAAQQSLLAQTATAPPAATVSSKRVAALNQNVWVGDFNGDGITDLVASGPRGADGAPPSLTIVLGNGDGTFGAAKTVAFTGHVRGVADVDKDGKLDLLVVDEPEPDVVLYVVFGNGDGTFSRSQTVNSADSVQFARSADLDGDGITDVVAGEGGVVTVYPGRSDGFFDLPIALTAGISPLDGIVADVNGDGRSDIVVANHDSHSLTVFLNQGSFSFTASDVPVGTQANDVTVGDVNGDGKLDLIAAGSAGGDGARYFDDGSAIVLLGNGNGTFGAPSAWPVAAGAWQVVVGDFNRDGVLDIATANRSAIFVADCQGGLKTWDSVSVLPGKGDGTFGTASSFNLGKLTGDSDDRTFRNNVRSLNTSDVNGDHATDLLVSWGAILVNQPTDPNWAPTVDAGPDQTFINTQFAVTLDATADDVDQDMLTYRWTSSDGTTLPPVPNPCIASVTNGTHTYTVIVDDGHGHQASDSVTVTVTSSGGGDGHIDITAPAVGEVVTGGQPYTIRWTGPQQSAGETLLVRYSVDGGNTWPLLVDCYAVEVRAGQCVWQNPGPDSNNQAFISMTTRDADFPANGATGPFTIRSAPGAPPWP